MGYGLALR